jgi:hypothetical protein
MFISDSGKVVCNDLKMHRLGELRRALMSYIPAGSNDADLVTLTRKDASNIGSWNDLDCFDKVTVTFNYSISDPEVECVLLHIWNCTYNFDVCR